MQKNAVCRTVLIAASLLGGAPGTALAQAAAAPDPFAPAPASASCRADAQALAAGVLLQIKSFVSAYQGGAAAPEVSGIVVVPHALAGNALVPYYLELRPKAAAQASVPAAGAPGGFGRAGAPHIEGGQNSQATGSDGGQPASISSSAQDAQRAAAYDALLACVPAAALSADEAAAKGIAAKGLGLLYVAGTGFVVISK